MAASQQNTQKESAAAEAKSIGPRNFRHNPDIENFYRFLNEFAVREEAKKIIEYILGQMSPAKKKRKKRSKKKVQ